jgi:DNA polymerase III epsilon subunit-like protein
MYLFFDTETTGLPLNWKAPVNDLPNWPRLVQLAWLLYDRSGNLLAGADHIIRPEGFSIPVSASGIHGITHERACREGSPIKNVLQEFLSLIDRSEILVAHNMRFDEAIVGAEFLRLKMPNTLLSKERICTMLKSTHFCKLDGPYGYKWPKLSELHYQLFQSGFSEAHNAAVDIQITAKCFFALQQRGVI